MQQKAWSALVVLVVFFCSNVEPCFITNCPRGGKRSRGASLTFRSGRFKPKECSKCGPEGQGRCFATDMCCGPLIGCYRGTKESGICGLENESTVPCMNDAPTCESVQHGQCVMQNYCCNDKGDCSIDHKCHQSLNTNRGGMGLRSVSREQMEALLQNFSKNREGRPSVDYPSGSVQPLNSNRGGFFNEI